MGSGRGSAQGRAEAVAEAQEAAVAVAALFSRVRADEMTVDQWQQYLAQVGRRLAVLRDATARISDGYGLGSGRHRLLHYLRHRVGKVHHGAELAGVSGIAEWARRIRELRVEEGWPIETGVQNPRLRVDEYVLVADAPDQALAARWRLAKEIRSLPGSAKDRVLEYLKRLSPQAADQDQLSHVAKISSWQRRLRELDEEGWEVRSNLDEPNLAPGSYRLASLVQRPPRARQAIKLRYEILERDGFACQDCGATPGQPGVRLQVHHRLPVHRGGTNEPRNLVTLCEADHAGRHALMGGQTVSDELLDPAGEPELRPGVRGHGQD